ncbi:hypothetical protein GW797_07630, partial [Candidatus Parcubacteria bacterium]|nr:hypothetical protein [Candidatus Parcubacteria bacterium]
DLSKTLNISHTGAITGTGYAGYFSKTGASTTNVGLYATASGATNNYAAIFESGNVGIGTTAPAQKLHVEGQCITGDSLLSVVSAKDYESGRAESQKLKAEKIPIKDITSDYYVYSLNQQTGELELQKINKLLDMGVKPVFKLTTESGKTIRTTGNHPYLIKKQNYDQQQRELLAFRRIESLAREYGLDSQDLSADREFSQIRTLWSNQPDQESSQFGSSQYSRGQGQKDGQGTKTISDSSQGLASRSSDLFETGNPAEVFDRRTGQASLSAISHD